jgi:Protein of unknown function (DUF4240)
MTTVLKINAQDLKHSFIDDLKVNYGDSDVEIRVQEAQKEVVRFTEKDFWNIISKLDWTDEENNEQILAPAIKALQQLSIAQIYQFNDKLSEKLWQLDTKSHAQPLIEEDKDGYFSEDEFLYARCCVVANGQIYFEKILNNPTDFPTDKTFEDLLYIASEAYNRKTGKKFIIAPAYNYETGSNKMGWQ